MSCSARALGGACEEPVEGYRPEPDVTVPFEAWHDLAVIGRGVQMYFGQVGGNGYLSLSGRVMSPAGDAINVRTTLADATFRAAP